MKAKKYGDTKLSVHTQRFAVQLYDSAHFWQIFGEMQEISHVECLILKFPCLKLKDYNFVEKLTMDLYRLEKMLKSMSKSNAMYLTLFL